VDRAEDIPPLRFDILEEVEKKLPNFPIVLHGSSSVPQEAVRIINEHGGKIEKAFGVPEEQLRKATKSSVCKINIDSDGRLWMTASIRKYLDENPAQFDPRKYLGAGREALTKMYMRKNREVLGSAKK
jgi:fructose-bisphosphate aldolase class II